MTGLYIHIPFCRQKCVYCDFPSFAGQEKQIPAYMRALKNEIIQKGARFDSTIDTIFIGGGTPSILPTDEMAGLLFCVRDSFVPAENAEWTCESNPGTLTDELLQVLHAGGVNRLSMGAQSDSERLLLLLGRRHNWAQVEEGVLLARKNGITNINIDLMFGLPSQTLSEWQHTLHSALALPVTHLSCYGLIVEEKTRMEKQVSSGAWTLPTDEEERQMYDTAREMLSEYGFSQYEISNFAKAGYECRHNIGCWTRTPYIGVGSAACGFTGNARYKNPEKIKDYINGVPPETEEISPSDARFESMMLGLRMTRGVADANFEKMHNMTVMASFGDKLSKPLREGLLLHEDGRWFLSRRGMDVQNTVLVDLMD